MTRARGLGKRQAVSSFRDEDADCEEVGANKSQNSKKEAAGEDLNVKGDGGLPQIYFPVHEEQGEIEQIESMLSHAELNLGITRKIYLIL